jgi:multidrug efflux pump subunit AcrB
LVLTPDPAAHERLKAALATAIAEGLAAEARLDVTHLWFGPPVPYPLDFHVMGPDSGVLSHIALHVRDTLVAEPEMHEVNLDWGDKTLALRIAVPPSSLRTVLPGPPVGG